MLSLSRSFPEQSLTALKPTELKQLYSLLRLPNRPGQTSLLIKKIMEIPINGYPNSNHYINIEAKKIIPRISGDINQIKRQVLKAGHLNIVYKIVPHNTSQWCHKILQLIQENDLRPLSETDLADVAKNFDNNTISIFAPTNVPIELQSESVAVQTNSAATQYVAWRTSTKSMLA